MTLFLLVFILADIRENLKCPAMLLISVCPKLSFAPLLCNSALEDDLIVVSCNFIDILVEVVFRWQKLIKVHWSHNNFVVLDVSNVSAGDLFISFVKIAVY